MGRDVGLAGGGGLRSPRTIGASSLAAPLAQPDGEFFHGFVVGRRLSQQSFKIVNRGDALLISELLKRRRRGAVRGGRRNVRRLLNHESRITGHRVETNHLRARVRERARVLAHKASETI
jgi:hypothetical protein